MDWPLAVETPLVTGDVELRAYERADARELYETLDDTRVWEHSIWPMPANRHALNAVLQSALDGSRMTFTIRSRGTVAGVTSYIWDRGSPNGVEIGGTRMSPAVWGAGVNSQAKHVLIDAAFGAGAEWIRFRTDERNVRSAAAIRKLGAVDIGVRPDSRLRRDGTRRASIFFELRPPQPPG